MYNGFKLFDTEVTLKVNSHIEDRAHAVPRPCSDRAPNVMCLSHSVLCYFHLKYAVKMCGKFVILIFIVAPCIL